MASAYATAQPLPVCVEAVLHFGYPKELVLSTYRRLCRESSHNAAGTGHNQTGATWAERVAPTRITAAVLMSSVEAILGEQTAAGWSSHSHRQDSLSEVGRGLGNDVEGDCPGEEDEAQASASSTGASDSNPDPRTATAQDTPHTTEVNATRLSASTTAGVVPPAASSTNTGTHAGAESLATGSTSNATSASESNASPADVSQASVSPASSSRLPTSHTPTTTSSNPSAPPSVSATERPSTSAEERVRERRRQQARLRALREENQRLRARQKCRHCHQQPVELTFLPCGHFLFCQSCGSSFQNCPACRKPIMADVKTFLA